MYGLVVQLEIDDERADEAIGFLNNVALPMIKQAPGFVSGTWMRSLDGLHTRSLIIFDTEEAAQAGAERARQGPPPGAPTHFVSAEVFDVMAQA